MYEESAITDSDAAIDMIVQLFAARDMPLLANKTLYLGFPFSGLKVFGGTLIEQYRVLDEKNFFNRMRYAGIVKERVESVFYWDPVKYPAVDPSAMMSALSLDFVSKGKNVIVSGPAGAGKTLLITILGCKALRTGYSVKFLSNNKLSTDLSEAKAGNSLSGYIKKLIGCDVLIIDDLSVATYDRQTAQSFFSIIDGRYGRKSILVASPQSISEWADRLPDDMGPSILGRFYENALIINMNGAKDHRLGNAQDNHEDGCDKSVGGDDAVRNGENDG